MEELAAALGATLDGEHWRFSADGYDWRLRLQKLISHTLLSLSTAVDPLPEVSVRRREKPLWRAYLENEEGLHVGDRDFLRAARVDSEHYEATVKRLFTEPVRESVLVVLKLGINRVAISGRELTLTRLDGDPDLLQPERFRQLLGAAAALRETLPVLPAELAQAPKYSDRRWWASALSLGAVPLLGLALLEVSVPYWMVVDRQVVWLPALAGAVFGWLIDPLRRRLQRALGDPRSIYQKFAWLSGLSLLFVSLFLMVNGVADPAPTVDHLVKVEEVRCTKIIDQARVVSWRAEGGDVWIPIPWRLVGRVKAGDLVHVGTAAGRLGYDWVRQVY